MAINEQEFEKLLQDYGAQRKADLDAACRRYRPPVDGVLKQVRAQHQAEKSAGWRNWLGLTNLFKGRHPSNLAWAVAACILILMAGIGSWAVWPSPASGQWMAFNSASDVSSTRFDNQDSLRVLGLSSVANLPEYLDLDLVARKVRFHSDGIVLSGNLTASGSNSVAIPQFRLVASGITDSGDHADVDGILTVAQSSTSSKTQEMANIETVRVNATMRVGKGEAKPVTRTYTRMRTIQESDQTK